MKIPKNLFFTKDHEWVRIEGKTAYVGITDYAVHALGDITFVELPKINEALKQASHCATVESVKAASDVYAPLSGKVLAVNTLLVNNPELINQSAYEKGYFFSMEITSETEKLNLMNASSYQSYIEGISK
jgi:glycine cleavage system H protein